MAKSSYTQGYIITTIKENAKQYGVVQAPFGLPRVLRNSCAGRGSSTGNPLEAFCTQAAPAPGPGPEPGNKDIDMSPPNWSVTAPRPKVDFGSRTIDLGSPPNWSVDAPRPKVVGGPWILNMGSPPNWSVTAPRPKVDED